MNSLVDEETLQFFFCHLFLPPKLPGGDDVSAKEESCLIALVLDSLSLFLGQVEPDSHDAIRAAKSMMNNMQSARDSHRCLQENGVQNVLQQISSPDTVAPFHITAQNAGVIVRYTKTSVTFELFELSPTNLSVITTRGRLVRQFPAVSIGVPHDVFAQGAFQSVLAKTLVKMSHQEVNESKSKAKKANQLHAEDRDTTDPRIVTQLLTSFLRGVGEHANVTGVCKNTREEVIWDNSKLRWGRSALWLLVRVSLQLTMGRVTMGRIAIDAGNVYKSFMVFLLARVLKVAIQQHSNSDVLETMAIKISRRLLKLTHPIAGEWLNSVRQIISMTSSCLDKRWQQIRQQTESQLDLAALSKLNMANDLQISLPGMENFISSIPKRDKAGQPSSFCPTSHVELFTSECLPRMPKVNDAEDLPFRLAMVESWVATHLDDWTEKHLKDESSCLHLYNLMQKYHSACEDWYASRPEGVSRMLLVILELWVAADKTAIYAIPLLRDYETEIPIQVSQALLLGFLKDMERLHRAESYLKKRQSYAKSQRTPSIYRSYGERKSFSVQYFSHSSAHLRLMLEIEEWAKAQKQAKLEEFRQLQKEYRRLMQLYEEGECQKIKREEDGIKYHVHSPYCNRCSFRASAANLSISVHEWPLPSKTHEAQTTVFELDLPKIFGVWRDTTLYFIDEVLKSTPSSSNSPVASHPLRTYQGLTGFFKSDNNRRVHLLSSTKPHVVSHRRDKLISHSSEADVCVNNGLRFQYFCDSRRTFLSEFTPSLCVSDLCSFKLPVRSQALRRFLVRTDTQPAGETPNQVIASQAECPEHMSMCEYKALATLPYGYQIQWMSVLTQLAMPDVDFNKAETAIFFLQLSLQVGTSYSDKIERCSHARLSEPEFGRTMLGRLRSSISRIRENWESYTALWIFTFLSTRLLSMVVKELRQPFIDLLKQCREISYQWLSKLRTSANETMEDKHRIQFLHIGLRVSLICMDTFNVEDEFLAQILSEPEQSAIMVEVSINICNNHQLMAATEDSLETETLMYDRCTYTLHRARPILVDEVTEKGNSCLDLAINRCWPAFVSECDWYTDSSTCDWLETTSTQQKVHFNILTGELLVDALPLSRLPHEFERHRDYQRLFGCFVLDVMPSSCPGMTFCSTKKFGVHTVYFGIEDCSPHRDILIRLVKGESILDLVPSRVLAGLLPHSFVNDYSHWYRHDNNTVEFCSLKSPWASSPENWTFSQQGSSWNLTRGGRISLLAPSNKSAKCIAAILAPLDAPLDLHMLFDKENDALEVKIPRLKLEFLLNSRESAFRSRQFRGMHVDADQSFGTLIGFTSKLVMQDSQNPERRTIIILEGRIQLEKGSGGHVKAYVVHGTASRVQRCSIDSQLCRLVDNGTVQSKLYLAYIHALTSYCLPDPFTGRTGTEAALTILRSASVRSIGCLTQDTMKTLQKIAGITPRRSYYPSHLQTMQTVAWSDDLSFLAQDSRFFKIVGEIIDNVSAMGFLYPSNRTDLSKPTHAQIDLVEREIIRNSRQQVAGSGAEDFTSDHDVVYVPRDRGQDSSPAALASQIACRVDHGLQSIPYQVAPDLLDHLYTLLTVEEETLDDRKMPQRQEMEYVSDWLQEPKTFLPSYWCRLHYAFQRDQLWLNKYQLIIWLTTISYATKNDPQVTQALLMLALSPGVSAAPLPKGFSFYLSEGYQLDRGRLESMINDVVKPLRQCPEVDLQPLSGESINETWRRQETVYNREKQKAIVAFLNQLVRQWPCCSPTQPRETLHGTYINVSIAMRKIQPKWKIWYDNLQFRNYLEEFICKLSEVPVRGVSVPPVTGLPSLEPPRRSRGFVSTDDLFSGDPPSITPLLPLELHSLVQKTTVRDEASKKLVGLLDSLDLQAKFDYERRYVLELRDSLKTLQGRVTTQLDGSCISTIGILFDAHLKKCKTNVQAMYDLLLQAIKPSLKRLSLAYSHSEETIMAIVTEVRYWPRVFPTFFLQQLGRSRWPGLSKAWKDSIVAYGIAITSLQQAQRLVQIQNNEVDLLREVENMAHKGWSPYKYPEWLLLECESGIMIREVQQQIAEHMMTPQSNQNALMQLNMGEGKSSVIVPIVAAGLSNGSQLVRVVVAKPQAKQMYQMLGSKVSGLLDRPVYQLPFSRAVRMSVSEANAIKNLVIQCIKEGGIMMVQPEHLLSFQLMGLECQINGKDDVASELLEMQRFLDKSSRDIVDESDENFSVKFELLYTMGMQRPIEHAPDRWAVIQEVLGRVAEFSLKEEKNFPQSIDIDHRHHERFPRIRILRGDAESAILDRVANSICDTGMTGFPVARQPTKTRIAVREYITNPNLSPEDIRAVEQSSFWGETTIHHILLLRGLISGGIIAFAFGQKRWRVDYGTDLNRETKTRQAVPFRAKDNPTPRSEFSHPDVVIILTCLSYYYKGLDDDDIFTALELLIRCDNADVEYQAWVNTAPSLPLPFRRLTGINVRDRMQCVSEIFPHLRYSKGAIDYFLSRMVFVKEAKEFSHKLSASGWDLGKTKTNPTMGFSGTNDSKYVLPLDIKQLDLEDQKHTNALVLKNLLRPENGIMLVPHQVKGAALEGETLFGMIAQMDSDPRVIIDVGAQIIDLDNLQCAKKWLDHYKDDHKIQAVVFFSDAEELTALDRSGRIETLQTSPFADHLDQCLVFLDEAHTRGTDLRLPTNYQAAVTLGADLTKDKLVQACMRMRKLGRGQSVVFCIPGEIEQKILLRKSSALSNRSEITVSDVLCWVISETWLDLQRTVPLWLTQGVRFDKQQELWEKQRGFQDQRGDRTEWAKKFLEDEAQSLDFRYRPRAADADSSAVLQRAGSTMGERLRRCCEEFGLTGFRTTSLQEEQERELSPETERERQVERPPHADPQEHACHQDMRHFIEHGEFPTAYSEFIPAFLALSDTSVAKHLDVRKFSGHVWVTGDFSRTIKTTQALGNCSDLFQRPVHWILTSPSETHAIRRLVIISPYEAHELLPDIEASNHVTLHLYAPRVSPGFQPLDQLTLYTVPQRKIDAAIPRDMMVYLNLFAGQLYLSSFQEYVDICDRLGLAWTPAGDSIVLGPDGFIPPGTEGNKLVNKSGFETSPVKFIKVLIINIRRNCEIVEKTHIGKILDGVLLQESDFSEEDESNEPA